MYSERFWRLSDLRGAGAGPWARRLRRGLGGQGSAALFGKGSDPTLGGQGLLDDNRCQGRRCRHGKGWTLVPAGWALVLAGWQGGIRELPDMATLVACINATDGLVA